jgi:hypothetical protein
MDFLNVTVGKLTKAVWDGRVDPPKKSPSGAYLWSLQDIERASWQLLGKPLGKELCDAK